MGLLLYFSFSLVTQKRRHRKPVGLCRGSVVCRCTTRNWWLDVLEVPPQYMRQECLVQRLPSRKELTSRQLELVSGRPPGLQQPQHLALLQCRYSARHTTKSRASVI